MIHLLAEVPHKELQESMWNSLSGVQNSWTNKLYTMIFYSFHTVVLRSLIIICVRQTQLSLHYLPE
jgi:hypothetical protein